MILANEFPADHPVLSRALSPEQVADLLVRGIDSERFLIVEDDQAVGHLAARATDYDAWLGQMGSTTL